jgi:hypothetical protein
MGDVLGYARVSATDQDLSGQRHRFQAAGATRIFEDVISDRRFGPPGWTALRDFARRGDALCVVHLDQLKVREIALMSLEEKIDTTSAAGELVFHVFGVNRPEFRPVPPPARFAGSAAVAVRRRAGRRGACGRDRRNPFAGR